MANASVPEGAPLDAATRARGRRLAIASHPAGMTHRTTFTGDLPTLVLVALGASESLVGLQRSLGPLSVLLQLPTLRAVSRVRKRTLLVAGHGVALLGSLPLALFAAIATLPSAAATALVLACLAVVAVGTAIGDTVWFPLLRGYVEPDRVGRFFGLLRTGWHVTLIAFFLGVQRWLAAHPGSFAPVFAAGALFGVLRIVLIARLPERSERGSRPIRVREAFALVREEPLLRRYLAASCLNGAVARTALPFAIVMMRRVVDMSDADVLMTTVATFAGGLAALYAAGRLVDRLGPAPILRAASLGMALALLALLLVRGPGAGTLALLVAVFFAYHAIGAAFGVADTDVLFNLAPGHAPARVLVVARVTKDAVGAIAPIAAGVALERALAAGGDALAVYHVFFAVMGALQAIAFLPLRRFRRARVDDAGQGP